MNYPESKFNDGVELAYVLYDAFGMDSTLRSGAPRETIEEAHEFSERIAEIAQQHRRVGGRYYRQGPRTHYYIPEPYESIERTADYMAIATINGEFMDKIAREYSAELIELLNAAVDGLIGRDVYIDGMNPHEFREKAA